MKVTDDNREQLVEVMSFLGIDPNMVSRDDDIEFNGDIWTHAAQRFEQEPLGGYFYDWPTSVTHTV